MVALLVAKRLLQAIPLLLLLSLVAFGLQALAPVDPARMALAAGGTGIQLEERDVAAKRQELGLDQPLWQQYRSWWKQLLRLDLGRSYMNRQPVWELLWQRLPASLALAGVASLLSVGLALPLGLLAAVRARGWLDSIIRVLTLLGASLPGFWLALLAIWLFAATLRWVPALGSFTPRGMVLPALMLALPALGRLTRLVRATALETLPLEYVQVARAKGLHARTILLRHVLPNALLPILAVIGLDFALMVGEAAVIEWVFAWPGLGRLSVEAALAGDLPVILGGVMVMGVLVVLVNLVVDVLQGLLDPRRRADAHG